MSLRIILVAAIAGIGGLSVGHLVLPAITGPTRVAAVETTVEVAPRVVPESQQQVQLSFAPVVRSVTPSVVNVYATTITQESTSPFANDPFFQRFFGNNGFETRPRQSQSLGSGVIVEASGVILTNSHVVNGATDIRVATSDGRGYPVDLALDDPKTDLTVLRVRDARGAKFPALPFADSDGLQVGDLVLAIGNPFGVGQTVTSGIVSALARTGVESSNYEFFIQTDAAINPGNSGGALVDLEGRLVGINTAIFSRSGGSVGIGFAIPANMASVVAEAGISGGALVRPWFGARLQEVTSDIASSLGLDRVRGVIVTEVAAGGPADRAGFKAGDVLLSVDGFEINQPSAFDFRLATRKLGTKVDLAFIRNGKATNARLTLEGAPVSAGEAIARVDGNTRFAGLTVESVNPAIAQDLGVPFNTRGVVVRSVEQGSPAQRMGLEVGDIILNLNGRDMTDARTFQNIAQNRPDGWQIVLQRGGRTFSSFVSG